MLDPKMRGSMLTPEQLLTAIGFICDCAKQMNLDVLNIRENVADYRDKEGLFSKQFLWEGFEDKERIIRPLNWWRGLRGTCPLADIAIRILGAPVTSAATERTFSTFSWIHSKKRNRLTTERAAKLTYLSYNWRLMNPSPTKQTPKKSKTSETPGDGKGENEDTLGNVEEETDVMEVGESDDEDFTGFPEFPEGEEEEAEDDPEGSMEIDSNEDC